MQKSNLGGILTKKLQLCDILVKCLWGKTGVCVVDGGFAEKKNPPANKMRSNLYCKLRCLFPGRNLARSKWPWVIVVERCQAETSHIGSNSCNQPDTARGWDKASSFKSNSENAWFSNLIRLSNFLDNSCVVVLCFTVGALQSPSAV